MIQTITQNAFIDAFKRSDERRDTFSYNALVALFSYIEEIEDSMGEQIELDVVAICCEWSEHKSFMDAYINIMGERPDADDKTEEEENAREYLEANTQVIEFDGGILVANF